MRATDEDPIRTTTFGKNNQTKSIQNTNKRVGRPRRVWANEASRFAWHKTSEELPEMDDPGYDSTDEPQMAELHLRAQLFMF